MRRQGAGQGVKAIAAHDVCVPVYAASLCACLLTAVTRTGWRSCGGIGVQQPAVCTYPYTTPYTCVQLHTVLKEGRQLPRRAHSILLLCGGGGAAGTRVRCM